MIGGKNDTVGGISIFFFIRGVDGKHLCQASTRQMSLSCKRETLNLLRITQMLMNELYGWPLLKPFFFNLVIQSSLWVSLVLILVLFFFFISRPSPPPFSRNSIECFHVLFLFYIYCTDFLNFFFPWKKDFILPTLSWYIFTLFQISGWTGSYCTIVGHQKMLFSCFLLAISLSFHSLPTLSHSWLGRK